MAYNAIIANVESVCKVPNADRLQCAKVLGYNVVVGLDVKINDTLVIFVDDGALSKEYLYNNNLYSKSELNMNPEAKGFFSENGRVRAQTFRGSKSEAYVAPLSSLKFTGYDISKLSVGDAFSELNGVSICSKYVTPATLKAAKENKPKTESGMNKAIMKKLFPEHVDTEQMRHARDDEFLGLVTITGKLHGTSSRHSYIKVPVEKPINKFQEWWNLFVEEIFEGEKHFFNFFLSQIQKNKMRFIPKTTLEWKKLYATRRVVKGEVKTTDSDYRTTVHKMIDPFMEKNEVWYLEIVGYEDSGAPIMQPVSTCQLKPFVSKEEYKNFQTKFGQTMTYKYSCLPQKFDIYVYRIATINEDGILYDLPWSVVKSKCNKAGIKHVPEIEQHFITDISQVADLKKRVEYLVDECEMTESIDASHIREGVCVRIDGFDGKMKIKKQKLYYFKILEGIVKDNGGVDEEESQGEYEEEEIAA